MALELLKILPPEIIMSILSKLPIRTITICKCVFKAWLHIVETPEFIRLHLSTSVPGLITFQADTDTTLFKFFEVEDEDGRDVEHHELHYNPVTKFRLPFSRAWVRGSVDGLFCLCSSNTKGDVIYICNPITRDYITIHTPSHNRRQPVTLGFGSCKMTGQYKLVWMLLDKIFDKEKPYDLVMPIAECHVYTLGAGSGWRRLPPCALLHCVPLKYFDHGAFANGNLHWLGFDLKISCFDLETETFSTFSPPPLRAVEAKIFALEESLYLCGITYEGEFGIWSMEEYGVAESWTMKHKLVIERPVSVNWYAVQPVKVFKDGDILMAINDCRLFCYSSKTTTIRQVHMFKDSSKTPGSSATPRCDTDFLGAISHTPSFRSLKSFGMENVASF